VLVNRHVVVLNPAATVRGEPIRHCARKNRRT
jgi:hypothetical protein